jgi:hypothetical protein
VRFYAKYLTLLPTCVTLSSNAFWPKIGLANFAFAAQHSSRDKVVILTDKKVHIFHGFVSKFGMGLLDRVRLPG